MLFRLTVPHVGELSLDDGRLSDGGAGGDSLRHGRGSCALIVVGWSMLLLKEWK